MNTATQFYTNHFYFYFIEHCHTILYKPFLLISVSVNVNTPLHKQYSNKRWFWIQHLPAGAVRSSGASPPIEWVFPASMWLWLIPNGDVILLDDSLPSLLSPLLLLLFTLKSWISSGVGGRLKVVERSIFFSSWDRILGLSAFRCRISGLDDDPFCNKTWAVNILTLAYSFVTSKFCFQTSWFELTFPDGQVEILEKYQKYCNIFPHIINFEVLLWFKSKLAS